MLHEWIKIWFSWVEAGGYFGIAGLMALESSVVPVPSEIVIPPAAYWSVHGSLDYTAVIIAGTLGSYIGSVVCYAIARFAGRPFLVRYGKYFLLSPTKLEQGERWIAQYGDFGVFLARLLPIVRHLISLPVGALKMPFWRFSLATLLGSALWCFILAWFGRSILGAHPELLHSPQEMIATMHAQMGWIAACAVIFALLYGVFVFLNNKAMRNNKKV